MRLVVCSLEPWDGVWRRNQYLLDALLHDDPGLEVIFVEPPRDPVFEVLSRRTPRLGHGLREVPGYGGRLHTLRPTKALPRRLGAAGDALLRRQLRHAVRRAGWHSPLLWVNDPAWARLVAETGWPALYDMTDDWVAAERTPREHARLRELDDELLEQCAEVVVCSSGLERRVAQRRLATLVPNAVDVERYRRVRQRPDDLPVGPVALYVGTLHEDRLDVELVADTAERLGAEGGRLVLLGPDALSPASRARLQGAAVTLLGPRERDAVPAYLQHAHALVVPHVTGAFTDSLDPIKLYEYLAVGRPIVSTPVAGFRELAGEPGVFVGAGPEFVAAARTAIAGWQPSRAHDGLPEWSERAQAVRSVLDGLDRVRR